MIEEHHVGQILKNVQVAFLNGLRSVHLKVKNFKGVANVKDALDQDVDTMTKDELHLALDEAFPDGSKHKARVTSDSKNKELRCCSSNLPIWKVLRCCKTLRGLVVYTRMKVLCDIRRCRCVCLCLSNFGVHETYVR